MRRALLVAAAMSAAVAAAGACTRHATETVVYIAAEGVRIPDDVHSLHFKVQDRSPGGDDTVREQDIVLCTPTVTTGCYNVPLTVDLIPGKTRSGDTVRIQVDANGPNGVVIADAALFTFADEQTQRLDVVLYANCLGNVECAKRDQACGPLDTCIDLHPTSGNGAVDFARPIEPADLSIVTPPDLTLVDLAGADLFTPPADLTTTVDLAGCAAVTCAMGQTCIAGVCYACGNQGDPCCFGPIAPPPHRPNAGGTGGTGTGTCNFPNLVCNGTTCQSCGNLAELCCAAPNTPCNVGMCGVSGFCEATTLDMSMPPDMDMAISLGGPDLML